MKGMPQALRKAEMLLPTVSLKADRYLGVGGRYRLPGPIAVRVASHPLRSAAVLAVPLAALAGMTFGAFSDGTRFLQAASLGTGLTLFFALCLRLERLTQAPRSRRPPQSPLCPRCAGRNCGRLFDGGEQPRTVAAPMCHSSRRMQARGHRSRPCAASRRRISRRPGVRLLSSRIRNPKRA